jgi:hypothetical protein
MPTVLATVTLAPIKAVCEKSTQCDYAALRFARNYATKCLPLYASDPNEQICVTYPVSRMEC